MENNDISIIEAMEKVRKYLEQDRSFYIAWQKDIRDAFMITYEKFSTEENPSERDFFKALSNEAAKRFLLDLIEKDS